MRSHTRVVALALIAAGATAARAQELPEMPGAIVRHKPRAPCVLETRVRGQRTGDGIVLEVWIRNLTQTPLDLTLRNPCSAGPAQFFGLPQKHDVYSGCNRGACIAVKPLRVALAPGAERAIAQATLRPEGDSCNAPLPSGVYFLAAQPLFESAAVETCSTSPFRVEVKASQTAPAPVVAPPPSPRPPQKNTRRIPCALGCPGGILDSDKCTCTRLTPTAPARP